MCQGLSVWRSFLPENGACSSEVQVGYGVAIAGLIHSVRWVPRTASAHPRIDVPSDDATQLTDLLQAALDGDRVVEEQLCQALVGQLRDRAMAILPREQGTLQATDLVHGAWIKVFRQAQAPEFPNRHAFFAYASRAMRTLLIDHLRQRQRALDGAGLEREPFEQLDAVVAHFEARDQIQLLDLEDALADLRQANERQFRTVELRYFGGMTMQQIADFLQVSLTTVENDWRLARAKLRSRLGDTS